MKKCITCVLLFVCCFAAEIALAGKADAAARAIGQAALAVNRNPNSSVVKWIAGGVVVFALISLVGGKKGDK